MKVFFFPAASDLELGDLSLFSSLSLSLSGSASFMFGEVEVSG